MELTAGQHGLEQVACIHGPVGLAGADNVVQLVDEEQDASVAVLDLLEDCLQALLELAAVLRPGDQGAEVEREDRPVLESLGNIAAHDALGEPLDDGRLADPGLADEHGVVLGLAREDPDDAANLFVAADDRIEASLAGEVDQVAAVTLEGLVGRLGIRAGDPLASPDTNEDLLEPGRVDPLLLEQATSLRAGSALENPQQEMLDADILVLESTSLFHRRIKRPGELRAGPQLSPSPALRQAAKSV